MNSTGIPIIEGMMHWHLPALSDVTGYSRKFLAMISSLIVSSAGSRRERSADMHGGQNLDGRDLRWKEREARPNWVHLPDRVWRRNSAYLSLLHEQNRRSRS